MAARLPRLLLVLFALLLCAASAHKRRGAGSGKRKSKARCSVPGCVGRGRGQSILRRGGAGLCGRAGHEVDVGSPFCDGEVPDYVDEPFTKWTWAMHFAMATMTTVGYGDITPTNTAEIIFTVCLQWVRRLARRVCRHSQGRQDGTANGVGRVAAKAMRSITVWDTMRTGLVP